ncbi:MAG: DNA translocase FtsK [Treponemataceae bacterium]
MKENNQLNFTIGFLLIIFAAFSMVLLLPSLLSTSGISVGIQSPILAIGTIVFSFYGFSSLLIPIFLLTAGITLFLQKWSTARGIYLLSSILPFFTFVLGEKTYMMITQTGSPSMKLIKAVAVLGVVLLVCVIEYIVINMIIDICKPTPKDSYNAPNVADPMLLKQIHLKIPQEKESSENTIQKEASFIEKMFSINPETNELKENVVPQEVETDTVFETIIKTVEDKNPLVSNFDDSFSQVDTVIIEENNDIMGQEVDQNDEEENLDEEQRATNHAREVKFNPQVDPESVVFLDLKRNEQSKPSASPAETAVIAAAHNKEFNKQVMQHDLTNHFEKGFSSGDETSATENDVYFDEVVRQDNLISEEESLVLNTQYSADEQESEADLPSSNFLIEELDEDLEESDCKEALVANPSYQKQSYANYYVPTEGILNTYPDGEYWVIDSATQHAGRVLKETLSEFKIKAEVTGIRKGPVITMFEILPAPGVKLAKIVGLQDNIALRLAASSVRIVAPIPGKHAVGIEVPNKDRAIVSFKELIETDTPSFKKMEIPVVLGKDISGEAQLLDLASTPHLLIAGSTGAGKSVCVNSMILSILYKRSPQEVKMILIDPKIVELKLYNDIPHLLTPVITEPKKAFQALQYCLCEMERRYSLLDRLGVRDIKSYNRRIVERSIAQEKLPYIVVIIDEFADLMATTGKELESTVARLAAMSRAVGIHIVLATQRPSIDVITGLIKANIPSRIAFMVASKMDSRIIIDQMGAEKLLGKGDMLYASAIDPFPSRIQGTFVSEDEVEKVVEFVKGYGEPEYIDDEIFVDDEDEGIEPVLYAEGDDPLYDKALEIVVQAGKASASYIQRRLKIGYNRAARLVEQMEERGIVGPANGSKAREIIHMP